jgi:hypothetical protein
MKTNSYLILILSIIFSCKASKNISPNQLIGKWEESLLEKRKDKNGVWSDWNTVTYAKALPQLEFTAKGKILWDGKPATSCCFYLSYKIENEKIILLNQTNSITCDCIGCDSWTVEKLNDEILELDGCFAKKRYFKVK